MKLLYALEDHYLASGLMANEIALCSENRYQTPRTYGESMIFLHLEKIKCMHVISMNQMPFKSKHRRS